MSWPNFPNFAQAILQPYEKEFLQYSRMVGDVIVLLFILCGLVSQSAVEGNTSSKVYLLIIPTGVL